MRHSAPCGRSSPASFGSTRRCSTTTRCRSVDASCPARGRQLGPEGLAQFQNSKFVMIDPTASNQDFWWFPYSDAESFKQG